MLRMMMIAITLCLSASAFAQDMTAEQRAACKADYDKFCTGTMPGGGRIIACLAKHNEQLAPACQKVIADAAKPK